jgi:hypothetical protein
LKSIDRDFLDNYEKRENYEFSNFLENIQKGRISPGSAYPAKHRLKVFEPYTKAIKGEKIWSQIPLYGTTTIVLEVTKKGFFEKIHGFKISDIDTLIDFAKEQGRIQFAISELPTLYQEMDYLEPIFRELNPPRLQTIPPNMFLNKGMEEKCNQELASFLDSNSLKTMAKYAQVKYEFKESEEILKEIASSIIEDGVRLRILGYPDSVFKEFLNQYASTENPFQIVRILQNIHDILLQPLDPLGGIISSTSSSMEIIRRFFPSVIENKNSDIIEFPSEVGRFIRKKLRSIVVRDLDGAIELSDMYQLYDLRKLMQALNEAVKREKSEEIREKVKEVDSIFENVWQEVSIYGRGKRLGDFAITLGLATVGSTMSSIGGIIGFLSGLGLTSLKKIVPPADISSHITEKALNTYFQWKGRSYLAHIYDFRKKYKLT